MRTTRFASQRRKKGKFLREWFTNCRNYIHEGCVDGGNSSASLEDEVNSFINTQAGDKTSENEEKEKMNLLITLIHRL